MLAQNFKTPAELCLNDHEFAALQTLLGMLERGEIPHHKVGPLTLDPELTCFDMTDWHCGSAACLGGWAEHLGKLPRMSLSARADRHKGMYDLFYPDGPDGHGVIPFRRLQGVTPSQAAIALRNFLTHGEPRWSEALAQ